MHHDSQSLHDIIVLLAAAIFVVAIFRQLRLSPVLGFLFAGAAIGPYGFEVISDVDGKSYLAEFGVVFLLFMIGLELSFKRLADMRAYVLGLGGLQFVITGLAFTFFMEFIMNYMGMESDLKVSAALGFAMALSSTAIVLQVLEERGERLSQVGRVSFSVLLLQDLAVVPLLILVPILATAGSADIGATLGGTLQNAVLVVVGMILFGKFLLNPVLSLIAKTGSSELFVALTLLVSLGAAYATEHAGLSLALGGFLSGLMIAETQFRKQVETDIMPFKGLLMGLFFMTVGMQFNLSELINNILPFFGLAVGLIVVKVVILAGLCRLFKLAWETSFKTSLLMAQGSEFAFILFGLAATSGLIEKDFSEKLLLLVTFSMALTPLLYAIVNKYYNKKGPSDQSLQGEEITQTEDLHGHLIVCGFGWVGENLAKFLGADNVNFVALDSEPNRVKVGRDMGFPVYYGDSSRVEILKSLKADKAKAIIITIHDSKAEIRIIQTVKNNFPNVPIIVRAKHIDNIEMLREAGATYVVPEAFESSIQIGKLALRVLGAPESEIMRTTKEFRDSSLNLDEFSQKEE